MKKSKVPHRETTAVTFAIVVLVVWAIVVLVSLLLRDYTELSIVTPVMLLAAGYVFGIRRVWGDENGSS